MARKKKPFLEDITIEATAAEATGSLMWTEKWYL